MLVKPLIIKHLTTTLIGPHGITDIIHANNTNLLPQMSATYGSTVGSSILLHHFHMEPMLDIAFLLHPLYILEEICHISNLFLAMP